MPPPLGFVNEPARCGHVPVDAVGDEVRRQTDAGEHSGVGVRVRFGSVQTNSRQGNATLTASMMPFMLP